MTDLLWLYLPFLAFGGILTGFSLIAGAVHHGDAAADAHDGVDQPGGDHEAIEGHEATGTHDSPESHDPDLPVPVRPHRRLPLPGLRDLSLGSLAFGASGSALVALGVVPQVSLACALGTGILTLVVSRLAYRYVVATQSGELLQTASLEGCTARVLVRIAPGHKGKIQVLTADGTLPLIASLADFSRAESLEPGAMAVIVGTRSLDGSVEVAAEWEMFEKITRE